ncbi:MAG: AMP-binding protein, partial [Promethearchaeota archaeon]
SPLKAKLGVALGKIPRMKIWPEKVGEIKCPKFQEVLNSGFQIDLPKVNYDLKKDTAILIYTGGTTGVPKGVMTSHYSMVVNALQVDAWASTQLPQMKDLKGKGGMLLVVPLAHSFGNIGMTVSILLTSSTRKNFQDFKLYHEGKGYIHARSTYSLYKTESRSRFTKI